MPNTHYAVERAEECGLGYKDRKAALIGSRAAGWLELRVPHVQDDGGIVLCNPPYNQVQEAAPHKRDKRFRPFHHNETHLPLAHGQDPYSTDLAGGVEWEVDGQPASALPIYYPEDPLLSWYPGPLCALIALPQSRRRPVASTGRHVTLRLRVVRPHSFVALSHVVWASPTAGHPATHNHAPKSKSPHRTVNP